MSEKLMYSMMPTGICLMPVSMYLLANYFADPGGFLWHSLCYRQGLGFVLLMLIQSILFVLWVIWILAIWKSETKK